MNQIKQYLNKENLELSVSNIHLLADKGYVIYHILTKDKTFKGIYSSEFPSSDCCDVTIQNAVVVSETVNYSNYVSILKENLLLWYQIEMGD